MQSAVLQDQWVIQNNSFIIQKSIIPSEDVNVDNSTNVSNLQSALPAYNYIEVLQTYKPRFIGGIYRLYQVDGGDANFDIFEHQDYFLDPVLRIHLYLSEHIYHYHQIHVNFG